MPRFYNRESLLAATRARRCLAKYPPDFTSTPYSGPFTAPFGSIVNAIHAWLVKWMSDSASRGWSSVSFKNAFDFLAVQVTHGTVGKKQ